MHVALLVFNVLKMTAMQEKKINHRKQSVLWVKLDNS